MSHLRNFVYAVMGDWWARMSGPLSIPATVLALWASSDVAKAAFTLTAILCVWVTAYRLWKPAKLSAVFNPTIPPWRDEVQFTDGRRAMAYRLRIENIGAETIQNCEGQVVEVAFSDEAAELGVTSLTWCGEYPLRTRIDLRGHFVRELDILNIFEDGTVSITTPGWPPNNRHNFFARRGPYRFVIVIGGDGTATLPPRKLRLNYTGNWRTSTMKALS